MGRRQGGDALGHNGDVTEGPGVGSPLTTCPFVPDDPLRFAEKAGKIPLLFRSFRNQVMGTQDERWARRSLSCITLEGGSQ